MIAVQQARNELSDFDVFGTTARFSSCGTRAVCDGGTVLEVVRGFVALRVHGSRQKSRAAANMGHWPRPRVWEARNRLRAGRGCKRNSIAAAAGRHREKHPQQSPAACGSNCHAYGSIHVPMMTCWTPFVTLLARCRHGCAPSYGAAASLKHGKLTNDALRLENVLDMKAFSR